VAAAPTKVGEYLATGLAVAATPAGDLESHFADAECSFVISDNEVPDRTAQRLADTLCSPLRQAESRGLADRYYSLDTAVEAYSAIYRRLGVRACA